MNLNNQQLGSTGISLLAVTAVTVTVSSVQEYFGLLANQARVLSSKVLQEYFISKSGAGNSGTIGEVLNDSYKSTVRYRHGTTRLRPLRLRLAVPGGARVEGLVCRHPWARHNKLS
eukprot:767347-Hanusia_phi.AAC.1